MEMSAEGQIAKSLQEVSVQPKKKKRLGYMDIARGIAMLCIIMGHFGIATVNRFVYSFHVPFFFLLSGYFYSQRGTWKEFVLTKAKQLLIPYAIGVAGIMVATSICFPLLGYSLLDLALRLKYILKAGILGAGTLHMVPFEIHQIGALWFLLALFFGNIILRFALQTKAPFLVVAASALAAWASSQFIWLPFSIQPGMFASLYLYLGYLAKQKSFLQKPARWWAVVASALLWAICIWMHFSVNIVEIGINGGLIAMTGAICASYIVVLASQFIHRHLKLIARFLNYFGQITLAVLIFHAMSDFVFPWYLLYDALAGIGIEKPLSHIVIVFCNVVWPLLGVGLIRYCKPLYKKLVPRDPQPLPAE